MTKKIKRKTEIDKQKSKDDWKKAKEEALRDMAFERGRR